MLVFQLPILLAVEGGSSASGQASVWDGAVIRIIVCGVGIKVEWIRGGGGAWEDNVVPGVCDGTFDVLATMGWYAEGIAPQHWDRKSGGRE